MTQHRRRRRDRHLRHDVGGSGQEVRPENDAGRLGPRRLRLPLRVRSFLLPQGDGDGVDGVAGVLVLDSSSQLYHFCPIFHGETFRLIQSSRYKMTKQLRGHDLNKIVDHRVLLSNS